MKISQQQQNNLWEILFFRFSQTTNKRIYDTFFVPVLLTILSVFQTGFSLNYLILSTTSLVIYLSLVVFIIKKNKKLIESNSSHSIILRSFLMYSYNSASLLMFFVFLWISGFSRLQSLSVSKSIFEMIGLLHIVIAILTITFASRILNEKTLDSIKNPKNTLLAIGFSGSIPGLAILISILLSRVQSIDLRSTAIMLLSLLASMLFVPYIVLGVYEIVYLSTQKWPEVKRLGSKVILIEKEE